MDDFLREALGIVKAQAAVRNMTEDEITSMVKKISADLRGLSEGIYIEAQIEADAAADAKKSIKERSITCLECGKVFRILSTRHLAQHGLDAKEYREKWGLKKGTALAARSLQRARRTKMKEMKLWERRGAKKSA
jgi:predicted transcriptional regulator